MTAFILQALGFYLWLPARSQLNILNQNGNRIALQVANVLSDHIIYQSSWSAGKINPSSMLLEPRYRDANECLCRFKCAVKPKWTALYLQNVFRHKSPKWSADPPFCSFGPEDNVFCANSVSRCCRGTPARSHTGNLVLKGAPFALS